jgi:hypothetical protein
MVSAQRHYSRCEDCYPRRIHKEIRNAPPGSAASHGLYAAEISRRGRLSLVIPIPKPP